MTVAIAIAVYTIGLLVFYFWGIFNQGWYEYYYLWDKGKDLLIFIALFQPDRRLRRAIVPVIIFSLIRFLWQVAGSVMGVDINTPKITDYLFSLLALVCSYLTLKELVKWHK